MSDAQQINLSPDVVEFILRSETSGNEAYAVLIAAFKWAETHDEPMTLADYQQRGANEAVGT